MANKELEERIIVLLREEFNKIEDTERKNKFMSVQEIYQAFSRMKVQEIVSAEELFYVVEKCVDNGTMIRYSKFIPDTFEAEDKLKNYPNNLYAWVK